jgi:hypothetical protein
MGFQKAPGDKGLSVVRIQMYSNVPLPPVGRVTLVINEGSHVGFGHPNSSAAISPPLVILSQARCSGISNNILPPANSMMLDEKANWTQSISEIDKKMALVGFFWVPNKLGWAVLGEWYTCFGNMAEILIVVFFKT